MEPNGAIDQKIDNLAAMVAGGFQEVHKRLDTLEEKVDDLEKKVNAGFEAVSARLDGVNRRIDAEVDHRIETDMRIQKIDAVVFPNPAK